MRKIGFSTGALAKGDFRQGISLQEDHTNAIELSSLRESELDALIEAIPTLNLCKFEYVSFHAPSHRVNLSEQELVDRLKIVADDACSIRNIIVHPDLIQSPSLWKPLGDCIVLENMDQRKSVGRTTKELQPYFDNLPDARFCFDIGHARQIDPTLCVAVEMLRAFRDRLAEIHISEVNSASEHVPISSMARAAFGRIGSLIPELIPAIIESVIRPDAIRDELEMARASLGDILLAPTNRDRPLQDSP